MWRSGPWTCGLYVSRLPGTARCRVQLQKPVLLVVCEGLWTGVGRNRPRHATPGCVVSHLTLTVPANLRRLIYQHAPELLSGLMQAAQMAIDATVAQAKRQVLRLGYIVVLQTAGRSASYNPHLHIIMTDGGVRSDGRWQRLGYVP